MWSLALTLLACLPAETLSLEQLIERARAAQAAAQGSIQPRLEEILGRLADPDLKDIERRSLRSQLEDMGAPAGPLLVAAMAGAAEGNPMLAGRLQEVLPGFDDLGTVLGLIAIVEDNQPTPMRLALPVLAQSQHREWIAARLLPRVAWSREAGPAGPVLACISSLRGPACLKAVEDALQSEQESRLWQAMSAVTEIGNEFAGPRLLELLETSHNYSLFLLAGEYFHAVPNALVSDPAAMERWLRLAEALPPPRLDELSALQKAALPKDVSRLPIGQAVAALLAEPEVPSSSPLREWLAGLEKRQPILEEDVRALLAKMGDGKSKREYIEPANREVSESRREDDLVQIQALSRRARRFLTVSDFGPALRDVEKARKLGEKTILGQGQAKALAILAARAQAGKGKLREAQQELESARLLNSDFELVRRDPYFRAFFASKFGRDFESNR